MSGKKESILVELLAILMVVSFVLIVIVFNDQEIEEIANVASAVRLQNKFANNSIIIPNLIYHSVRPHILNETALQDRYDITPEALDKQFQYLIENGYHTIYPRDLNRYANGSLLLPQKPIIISFDDGWENQYLYGLPVLKKYGLVAVFYLYTNPIGRYPHFLTWSQIKDLYLDGMEIGGHTESHALLEEIDDMAILRKEIVGGKLLLERALGTRITSFAYPYGYYNDKAISVVRFAGFTSARGTYKGTYSVGDNLYTMKGFLADDNFQTFVAYLNGK